MICVLIALKLSRPMSKCKYCEQSWHTSSQCFYKPNKLAKPCKYCKGTSHLSWQCRQNPNRAADIKKKLKRGKVSMQWVKTRRQWFKLNKADYYVCYICGRWLSRNETTLDHIKSRGRHPELRSALDNLAPCCFDCNQKKGSRSLGEMRLEKAA